MTLLSLQSQFCFKMKDFSHLVPQEQAFLWGTWGPVLVDLHPLMTPESPSCSRAWWSTAQGASQGGRPPLGENLNSLMVEEIEIRKTWEMWNRVRKGRFLRWEHIQVRGPVWTRDTGTSPFSPVCCLQCNLVQQFDEEVISSQIAFTLPFYLLMEVLQDQKFKYKFILKQSANMVLTYLFPLPLLGRIQN